MVFCVFFCMFVCFALIHAQLNLGATYTENVKNIVVHFQQENIFDVTYNKINSLKNLFPNLQVIMDTPTAL